MLAFSFTTARRPERPERPEDRGPSDGSDVKAPELARFGFRIFLLTPSMMFGAVLLGFTLLLLRGEGVPSEFRIPELLWISCGVALLAPLALGRARRLRARGRPQVARRFLLVAILFATLFLGFQVTGLFLAESGQPVFDVRQTLRFSFYCSVGLHLLHGGFGLLALLWVLVRDRWRRRRREEPGSLLLCSMYQSFLATSWVLTFAVLQLQQTLV